MGIPTPLVAAASITSYWVQESSAIWIVVFVIPPILFNFLNVRRFGEIEFWFSTIKVYTIVGLIILGLLLFMDATTAARLLGTRPLQNVTDYTLIPCDNPHLDDCVSFPGFNCTAPLERVADLRNRLARRWNEVISS